MSHKKYQNLKKMNYIKEKHTTHYTKTKTISYLDLGFSSKTSKSAVLIYKNRK